MARPLLSVLVGVLQLLAYLRAERMWKLTNLIEKHKHAARTDRRAAAGARWHRVHVETTRQSLGSSIETPSEMSATPLLTTDEATVIDDTGRRLRIVAGKSMKIELPGSRRNLVDAVTTTQGGVEQRYSFEVDPDVRFMVLGVIEESRGTAPFRDAPASELMPFEDSYLVGKDTDEADPKPSSAPGCGKRSAYWMLFINLVGAGLSPVPYVGWTLWGLAAIAGGLWLLGHLIDGLDPPELQRQDEDVQRRVRGELEA